ncbi:MAG TPA: HD domain-containing protein, partial [Promineifilum sp.]|nr:HD domain-containing protein [Promineifilum sp.]
MNEADRARMAAAVRFALDTYGETKRTPDETYVEHGRNVAAALAEIGIDDIDTVIAALLHEIFLPQFKVAEGTLVKQFGQPVVSLI